MRHIRKHTATSFTSLHLGKWDVYKGKKVWPQTDCCHVDSVPEGCRVRTSFWQGWFHTRLKTTIHSRIKIWSETFYWSGKWISCNVCWQEFHCRTNLSLIKTLPYFFSSFSCRWMQRWERVLADERPLMKDKHLCRQRGCNAQRWQLGLQVSLSVPKCRSWWDILSLRD